MDDLLQAAESNCKLNEPFLKKDIVKVSTYYKQTPLNLILDTGSQVNIIGHDVFIKLQEKYNNDLLILPTGKINIQPLSDKLNNTAQIQTELTLTFKDGNYITAVFIVLKNIPRDIVLIGTDTLASYRTIIDFEQEVVTFRIKSHSFKLDFLRENLKINHSLLSNTENLNTDRDKEFNLKLAEIFNFQDNEVKISTSEKEKLANLYEQYMHVFDDNVRTIPDFEASFELIKPIKNVGRQYSIPHKYREEINEYIDRMIKDRTIEDSKSDFVNPLVVIRKPDNTLRLCLDLRHLNEHIKMDRNRPETMANILQRLEGKKIFSSFDLSQGYHNLKVRKDLRDLLSFSVNGNLYRYRKLPYGLRVSGQEFIRCIRKIFGTENKNIFNYIDDFLIASSNMDEHIKTLKYFFNLVERYNIPLKLKKSQFLTNETKFLGYIVTSMGIKIDKSKVDLIQNFKRPENIKQLQSFLGLVNFFRIFHKNHSELTCVLTELLKKGIRWRWTATHETAFNKIKEKFLEETILRHPDFSREFHLFSDSSNFSISSSLMQYDENNELRPIAFASKSLSNCQRKYSICEREVLALTFGIDKFKDIIAGNKIVVHSDHQAISFFKKAHFNNPRLHRWMLAISQFDIDFQFIKGSENVVADVLSRLDEHKELQDKDKETYKTYEIIETHPTLRTRLKDLRKYQLEDNRIKKIIKLMQKKNSKIRELYKYNDDILFKKYNDKYVIVLPSKLELSIIDYFHESYAHVGNYKLVKLLSQYFDIKGLTKKAASRNRTCDLCQRTKPLNVKYEVNCNPITTASVLDSVFCDVAGPMTASHGKKYMFLLVDNFTKYVKLYPIHKPTAYNLLRCVKESFVREVGFPKRIISDNASQFTSKVWMNGVKEVGIKPKHVSLYHPSSNVAEKFIQRTKRLLRLYCNTKQQNWVKYLPLAEDQINLTHNQTTGEIPYIALFGRKPLTDIEKLIKFPKTEDGINLQLLHDKIFKKVSTDAQKRLDKFKAKNYKVLDVKANDLVLVRHKILSSKADKISASLSQPYQGPYKVLEKVGTNAWKIEFPKGKEKIYNLSMLKKYFMREDNTKL